jgi:hypothetical protein
MASLRILIKEIVEQFIIQEIGEGTLEPFKYNKITNLKYKFDFQYENENFEVEVDFEKLYDMEYKQYYFSKIPNYKNKLFYNVSFSVNGDQHQASSTDLKTLLKIMSTLSYIIKDFISIVKPDGLYVEATDKNDDLIKGKKQKFSTYQAYLDKQIESLTGYKVYLNRDGINIIKI